MLKRIVSGIMLTLLFIGILTLAFNIQQVRANGTIYIRADGSIEGTINISSADNITYTFTDNIKLSGNDHLVVERDNIVLDGAGYTLEGPGWQGIPPIGIYLAGRTNVTIRNMKIEAFDSGIYLSGCSKISIFGNNIVNNIRGIQLHKSPYNTISGNVITNSSFGIEVYDSSSNNNIICGNTIANNQMYGVQLRSPSNTVSENNITNNDYGIKLRYESDYNSIFRNSITNNTHCGIHIDCSTTNTIFENNITNNGEDLGPGWYPAGIYIASSSNNIIYHNNFIDNYRQALAYSLSAGALNVWDDGYPSGGNYWSDYTGTDANGDGIGDTPYVIHGNIELTNQDRYPLMRAHGSLDNTPPTISVLSPENETYSVEDVPLTFTVSESTSWIGYSLDSQDNVTVSGNTTLVGLSDGAYTITIYANDTTGNMGSSITVYFTIDTAFPNIAVLSPQNTTYADSSVSLSFTVEEAASWIGYSLDGKANVTITGNTALSGLSDGSHRLTVYAKDTAGNTYGASETIYFTVDTEQREPFPTLIVYGVAIATVAIASVVVAIFWRKRKQTP